MPMPQETVAKTVDTVLEVLGTLGLPGTKIAQLAVKGVESLRQEDAARERLGRLVREAEADFVTAAREAGLGRASGWVGAMPLADLPTFREALQLLGKHWDEAAVEKRLVEEFAHIQNLSAEEERRALALYLRCLRARLLADKDLGPVITGLSMLRTEQGVEQALKILNSLLPAFNRLLGLPEDLVAWPVEALSEPLEARPYVLKPQYRLIPYTGQAFEGARDELLAWARDLETGARVGLRTYTGRGGAGKTRLLLEVGEALRREGWWVGFLSAGQLQPEHARLLCADARPTLLIIDYIAKRNAEVDTLLLEMARAAASHAADKRTAPFALVLLERTFPTWLQQILESVSDPYLVKWHEFVASPGVEVAPRALPDVEIADREQLYKAALEGFLAHMPGQATLPRYRAEELPKAPLLIALLALHAAAGQRMPDLNEAGILGCTWKREKEAWERHLRAAGAKEDWEWQGAVTLVERLSVWATLGRRFEDVQATATFLEAHTAPIKGRRTGEALDFEWLAGVLPQLFPQARGDLVPPIEPDPLADYVLRERLKTEPELLEAALPDNERLSTEPRQSAEGVLRYLEVLVRVGDTPETQEQMEDWLERVLGRLRHAKSPAFWGELEPGLKERARTIALLRFLAEVYEEQLALLAKDGNAKRKRPRLLISLGETRADLGQHKEALDVIKKAIDVCRGLVKTKSQGFLSDLARSLNDQGAILFYLGQRGEALEVTKEAVNHYRVLSMTQPEESLPDLAKSLTDLGSRYHALNQPEEAQKVTEEAVNIYRAIKSQALQPNLAQSLYVYGSILGALGHPDDAQQAFAEGLRAIVTFAQAPLPPTFEGLPGFLLKRYLRACEDAGVEADAALVAEIEAAVGRGM